MQSQADVNDARMRGVGTGGRPRSNARIASTSEPFETWKQALYLSVLSVWVGLGWVLFRYRFVGSLFLDVINIRDLDPLKYVVFVAQRCGVTWCRLCPLVLCVFHLV